MFYSKLGRVLPALVLSLSGTTAYADEPAPASTLSANVTAASQYISRGVRQTWGHPALQGGVDYVHASGWSAGTWVSTVSDKLVEGAKVEWDLYGGYTGSAGPVGYSALLYYYRYPGARVGSTNTTYDYGEVSLGLTYGVAYAKLNYTVTPTFFGIENARGTRYYDIGANPDLGNGYVLNLHAGTTKVGGAGNAFWNWQDAKIGVTRSFDGGWSSSLALTRAWGPTDAYTHYTTGAPTSSGQPAYSNTLKTTLVLSVTRTF